MTFLEFKNAMMYNTDFSDRNACNKNKCKHFFYECKQEFEKVDNTITYRSGKYYINKIIKYFTLLEKITNR